MTTAAGMRKRWSIKRKAIDFSTTRYLSVHFLGHACKAKGAVVGIFSHVETTCNAQHGSWTEDGISRSELRYWHPWISLWYISNKVMKRLRVDFHMLHYGTSYTERLTKQYIREKKVESRIKSILKNPVLNIEYWKYWGYWEKLQCINRQSTNCN